MTDVSRLNAVLAGRYVIEREIGRGGMATVYLARDERHQRSVAVKVLRPDLAAQLGGERFLREIRIASSLQHPNILTLIDSGDAGGVLHYVMPFVEGQSLREKIAAGPIPVPDAVRIVREILDALSYAHAHGFVHRDVKPENVILSGRHAMVVDFGVAKAMSAARARDTLPEPAGETLTQIGTSIGTPAYMAPEQAAGDPDVDHRADIYAAGIIMYEMLAGRPPFVGHPAQVLSAQISVPPEPLSKVAPSIPAQLAAIVMRCLEKDPAARYQSADDLVAALDDFAVPRESTRILGLERRTATLIAAGLILIVGTGAIIATRKLRNERWVRTVAIPEIQRLVDANNNDSAFVIGTRAQRLLPNDSTLNSLAARYSAKVIFTSLPPGTRVWRTRYNDSTGWTEIRKPAESTSVPAALARWRFEKPGYHTLHVASANAVAASNARYTLAPLDSSDGRMVLVRGGQAEVALPGLSRLPVLQLPDFWIDKHEVTNADFKRFVDAGGYEDASYWEYPVVENGRVLSRAEVKKRFVDRTGRPGPAGWEGGTFPAGQEDIPVGGLSWYEAMAYAKFAGKSLPTVYHWARAASAPQSGLIIPGSNYGGQGPVRGGTFGGMGLWGTFDMAGNVREWVWNATGDQRFILGGGWNDGTYTFSDAYAQRPIDRSVTNGFRLVKPVAGTLGSDSTRLAVARQHRDYARERPVGDAVFAAHRSFFRYDQTPFNAKLDYRDTSNAQWIRERWSFDAAYGGERTGMVLFIPRDRTPPYQAVLAVGGSNFLYVRSDSAINVRSLDFIVRSGRVVAWPIVKGMFDRNQRITTDAPMETSFYRDLMVAIVKDVRRGIDWLGTRADIDTTRLAYVGLSFGGRISPPILGNEPRFKAAILYVTGLKMERTMPEVDPINFLPRIRMPVLMLNGQHDYYFPVETAQRPFYEYLGTPVADKKWLLYPEAHSAPRAEFIKEALLWLDKYLGVPR